MKLEFDFFPVLSPNFLLYAHFVASYLVATYDYTNKAKRRSKVELFSGLLWPTVHSVYSLVSFCHEIFYVMTTSQQRSIAFMGSDLLLLWAASECMMRCGCSCG